MSSIADKIQVIQGLNLAYSKTSLAYFLNCIVVPCSPEPKPFRLAADDWQREALAPMVPAFEYLAGFTEKYAGPLQFMKILARGHNKSSEQAWLTCWLLLASKRTIHGYIMAADRDQGRLVIQAAKDFLALNPWIPVTITKDRLTGPAGEVEVLPFDARSGMGLRGNYFMMDEIVHWKRQDEWTAIMSGEGKVSPCLWAVMSNAGLIDSWQHQVYEAAKRDKNWVVFHRPGTLASWLNREKLERSRLMLPPSEAERLIDNKWIDPSEEHDYLRRAEVNACAELGAQMQLQYRHKSWQGVSNYVGAIDYGVKRDRTALVILHLDGNKRTVIDRLDVWQGSDGKPVRVAQVEEWIERTNRDFRPRVYVIDPWQMEGTIQWCEKKGIKVEPFKFRSGQGNFELAQHLRAIVADRRLVWYPNAGALPDDTLEDELSGLRVKRMSYGYRFDHEVQKHDDRAFVIAAAALKATEYPFIDGNLRLPPPPNMAR